MNKQECEDLKNEIIATGRGPFVGWWANLLEVSPRTLKHVHEYLSIAENDGEISEKMRHLIWVVVDSLVTHLYPRGAGVHARIAIEHGATPDNVIEALEIATYVSNCAYEAGLPVVFEVIREMGLDVPGHGKPAAGDTGDWTSLAQQVSPKAYQALERLAQSRPDGTGLSTKDRELLFYAGYCSPAMVNPHGTKRHAKRAVEAGATVKDLVQVLRLANCIGLHAMAEGATASMDSLRASAAVQH